MLNTYSLFSENIMSSFLEKYKRQAKLYIDLPSSGIYYDDSVVQDQQYVHLPVHALTAADEITIKTPDILFSGQATADIIKSCVPSILDPWKLVKPDVDYILSAIKLATYGETSSMTVTCPKCGTESEAEIKLQDVLDFYENVPQEHVFSYQDLEIQLTPVTYTIITKLGLEMYNLQRTLVQVQASDMTDEEKTDHYAKAANEMKKAAVRALVYYVTSISSKTSDDVEDNNEVINDFIYNNDNYVATLFTKEVDIFLQKLSFPEQFLPCSNEECDHTLNVKYSSDYSTFFDRS